MPNYTNNASIEAYYQGMKEPVNAQITQAGNDYEAALKRLEQTKATQDAENYRSYVRQQQELPGIMRASGNNGGMVDSAVASLANAYNQARAKRSLEYEGNRANQDLDYNNRLAALRAQLAQYDQMAAADKANLLASQASGRARRSSKEDESGVNNVAKNIKGNYAQPTASMIGRVTNEANMTPSMRLNNVYAYDDDLFANRKVK